jgi:ribosomal protein S12 methylthiotransferase
MPRFHVETLGCPKNAVDSDKLTAGLLADGLTPASGARDADLVVVNTCAFVEAARQESIETILALAADKPGDARLVVTGCMAERYGAELAAALPEVAAVVGFAGEGAIAETVHLGMPRRKPAGVRDLLELTRPAPEVPWAYLKVAEGCDRACAFCAIPSFRGKQRSRRLESIETEARGLIEGGVRELVLVAQDLAWYGRDVGEPGALAPLLRRLDRLTTDGLARLRLLYLYPSEVRDPLVATMLELPSVVPYFDLSLQHAEPAHLRAMRRWGSGERFLSIIERIRAADSSSVFRSSFIVGYPGGGEREHDSLLEFLEAARLEWAGFFAFSPEQGTPAAARRDAPVAELVHEWLRECAEVQEPITRAARDALVGEVIEVLVETCDDEGVLGSGWVGRTHREAPEIDGVVFLDAPGARVGDIVRARVTDALGTDLVAKQESA